MRPEIARRNEACEPLLSSSASSTAAKATSDKYWAKVCCFGVMVLISISYEFSEAPLLRLYQDCICSESGNPVSLLDMSAEGGDCMSDSVLVQKKLASVTSKQVNLDTALALIASIYTPLLLRQWGTKRMLQLNLLCRIIGQLWIYLILGLHLVPVEWTWLSSLTIVVASGPYMRQELLFMIIASVTPEEKRFSAFTFGQIIVLLPGFLAKRASALLMKKCIWYPLALGIASLAFAIAALAMFMPSKPARQHITGDFTLKAVVTQFGRTLYTMIITPTIFFLIVTFCFTNVFGQLMAGSTLLQVLTNKFRISLEEASKIQSWSNVADMVSLPMTFVFLRNRNTLNVCCFCAISMMIGLLLIGIARHWVVVIAGFIFCAAGQGFRMAARSELTSAIGNATKDDISRLYILVFFMDTVGGGLFNAWVLSYTFNEGLDHGGVSLGLPLFVAVSEWYVVAMIVITINTLQKQGGEEMNAVAKCTSSHLYHPHLGVM